jgi:hypothetical protein
MEESHPLVCPLRTLSGQLRVPTVLALIEGEWIFLDDPVLMDLARRPIRAAEVTIHHDLSNGRTSAWSLLWSNVST